MNISKLAHAGESNTTSGFRLKPLSIALCIVSSKIIFSNPFCFKFSSKRFPASPIKITVFICLLIESQNSFNSVFLSRPPAIRTTSLSLKELIATIADSGFVAFESL